MYIWWSSAYIKRFSESIYDGSCFGIGSTREVQKMNPEDLLLVVLSIPLKDFVTLLDFL